ncbi:hypothetical protein D0Y65_010440 [Glycine soja]|uniref:Uncharacterized protein n=1 Tax=Glycine soja TaxID=3848 RepID=A0A445L3G4_GLYSO|nr:hypothetical protein D0Y65_010440 [Glycine soja]
MHAFLLFFEKSYNSLYNLISSASEKYILNDIVQSVQFNSHGSSVSSQSGIGLGVQSTSLGGISSASLQQPPNPVHSPSSQQPLMPDVGNSKIEEQ